MCVAFSEECCTECSYIIPFLLFDISQRGEERPVREWHLWVRFCRSRVTRTQNALGINLSLNDHRQTRQIEPCLQQ